MEPNGCVEKVHKHDIYSTQMGGSETGAKTSSSNHFQTLSKHNPRNIKLSEINFFATIEVTHLPLNVCLNKLCIYQLLRLAMKMMIP